MKLNAVAELEPVTWPEFCNVHPFAPESQMTGYKAMIDDLNACLATVTGFAAVSTQPNSGATGEYAGLLAIKAFHEAAGEGHRNICLIPQSAHGTNPASAVMAGMKVVVVKSGPAGNIDFEDFSAKAEKHAANLSAVMITYPSTYGVFEERIKDMTALVHEKGGQVYMDGANMNAQIGYCSPGSLGADVCHLNLHKTFAIPHGGGGPGVGSIGVAAQLAPYLPGHAVVPVSGEGAHVATKSHNQIAAAPYGSAGILPISWMYVRMLGAEGLKRCTQHAILNANYMMKRLEGHYDVMFTGTNGQCAHEFILDVSTFGDIGSEDIAKRLVDFGFHAPTMSWPVPNSLMIEPTESEPLVELDAMCEALIQIREEIRAVEDGEADPVDNVLRNAPHTAQHATAEEWTHPYSREEAVYPLPWVKDRKFWPKTRRIDNTYGDRNLMCTCPPLSDYE
jgi:glycine dehydrogenase